MAAQASINDRKSKSKTGISFSKMVKIPREFPFMGWKAGKRDRGMLLLRLTCLIHRCVCETNLVDIIQC